MADLRRNHIVGDPAKVGGLLRDIAKDLAIDQVVEIHMKLIDDLARELRVEGLHPDFLSDYRLTLIDVIAHLGEMYRSVLTENCVPSD